MTGQDVKHGRVSVVIPTYERPEYLEGAIETALGQTYDNLEVIVVDDGSEEPYAGEIVSTYPELVTHVRHEKNQGLSAARNTGIETSTGEYIAFLDDDDRWHETKLSRQIKTIEKNTQAGLATCLVVAISPDYEIIHCERSAPSGDCSDELLVENKIGTPSRVLIRRAVIDDIGTFDESLPTKQDWDFYLRLCQDWQVAAVEDYLCFRTIHESMSSSPGAVQRDKRRILEKHEDLIRRYGFWEQAQGNVAEEVGRAYLGSGNLKSARDHLRKSISLNLTTRRAILLLLSYTNLWVINKATDIKREIEIQQRQCSDNMLNENRIPGLYHSVN